MNEKRPVPQNHTMKFQNTGLKEKDPKLPVTKNTSQTKESEWRHSSQEQF